MRTGETKEIVKNSEEHKNTTKLNEKNLTTKMSLPHLISNT